MVLFKKLKSDFKEAKKEFSSNYKDRCSNLKIKPEIIKRIGRLQYLFILTKWYWIFILIIIIALLLLINYIFEINIAIYFIVGSFGLFFQFLAALFFIKPLIKNKYLIVLESTTRLTYNPDLVKTNIENTFNATIGWIFLLIGFSLQSLALLMSLVV